jgi:hypothetical protein
MCSSVAPVLKAANHLCPHFFAAGSSASALEHNFGRLQLAVVCGGLTAPRNGTHEFSLTLVAALRRGRLSRLAPTVNSGHSAGQFNIRNTRSNSFNGETTT